LKAGKDRLMLNRLERLAFLRPKAQSKVVGRIISWDGLLRNFIYLDVALIVSYLERLIGGVPQEA
jgi:hypothetical protein